MQLTVSDISISGHDFAQTMSAKKLDLECKENLHIEGKASRSGTDVFIKAKVSCILVEECDRCLGRFDFEVEAWMDLFFQPQTKDTELIFQDLDADDLGTLYYRDNTIDLTDAIRDTILLERPIKVICSEDCAGLCVSCGVNLNESECNCNKSNQKYNPFMEFLNDSKKNSHRKA